jgi:hypothetical protein
VVALDFGGTISTDRERHVLGQNRSAIPAPTQLTITGVIMNRLRHRNEPQRI